MQKQNWVPLKNFEPYYEISTTGKIRSLHKRNFHNIISQRVDRAGYVSVRLCKNGLNRTHFLHRLLAETFIANPTGKPLINHIDGNKQNNQISNLEWCTYKENAFHAVKSGLFKVPQHKCKRVFDSCANRFFKSISEAARAYNIPYSSCKNMLAGKRPNSTCLKLVA